MSMMGILDPTGHREVKWNHNDPNETEFAEEMFDDFIEKGYQAFRVSAGGKPAERMSTFDPTAEAMILVPQRQGG